MDDAGPVCRLKTGRWALVASKEQAGTKYRFSAATASLEVTRGTTWWERKDQTVQIFQIEGSSGLQPELSVADPDEALFKPMLLQKGNLVRLNGFKLQKRQSAGLPEGWTFTQEPSRRKPARWTALIEPGGI